MHAILGDSPALLFGMTATITRGTETGEMRMLKYEFAIQTRNGQKIDSIVIAGRDQADAERKLVQMYRHCTVLTCTVRRPGEKTWQASSMEDILTLISK